MKEKQNKKGSGRFRRSGVGAGTTSLLVIFTVLCMATLALLSVSTAVTNRKINQNSYARVRNILQAEGKVSEKLSELDALLLATQQEFTGKSEKAYFNAAFSALESNGCTVQPESKQVEFVFAVDEGHVMVTRLEVLPQNSSMRYRILEQSTQITIEWEPEAGQTYWPGPQKENG